MVQEAINQPEKDGISLFEEINELLRGPSIQNHKMHGLTLLDRLNLPYFLLFRLKTYIPSGESAFFSLTLPQNPYRLGIARM